MPPEPLLREATRLRFRCHADRIEVATRERVQFVDLTTIVAERLRRSGIVHGTVNVQTRHTTTGIVVNEHEPLLIEDLGHLLERWAPQAASYRHDDLPARTGPCAPDERPNADAHARAVLLGASETLNVADGRLDLGRWQRVFLVELDGPRIRAVSLAIQGLAAVRSER
jgi:secondary thiamine-phosphate synthase enzyme